MPAWRAAVRAHLRRELDGLGYRYTSAKEIRREKRNDRIYDFVLASKHPLARKLFEEVCTHGPG